MFGEETSSRLRVGAILGDLNDDGVAEFEIGEGYVDHGGTLTGRVTIYEGFPADVLESGDASIAPAHGIALEPAGPISIGNNALRLVTTEASPSGIALFFYGPPRPRLPLDGSWLCTGPPLYFLAPALSADPTGFVECPLDFTLPPLSDGPSAVFPSSTWSFQLFCRDATQSGTGPLLSAGLLITFPP